MKRRALVSVYNKEGIVDFARELVGLDYEIVSTGGTYDLLAKEGIQVVNSNSITGFTQLLDGKVKTLHPKIHAGILADITNNKEVEELAKNEIEPFSLVVVNLYPFEETAKREDATIEDLIKDIDIGGITMIRAAAKNHKNVGIICDKNDYTPIISVLKANNGELPLEQKRALALKAFDTSSSYDRIICDTLSKFYEIEPPKNIKLTKIQDLRYGENPHQKAALYKQNDLIDYDILHGKELSYNNITDVTAAVSIVAEFYDVPCVAIIKHGTPCGVALGSSIQDAYLKAFDCDPISAFGGIIALSQPVTLEIAKHAHSVFLEVIIAPDFTPEAFELLSKKKNIRLIKLNTPLKYFKSFLNEEIKVTPFGILVQDADVQDLNKDDFKVVTKTKPTAEMIEDMVFAFKVVKHTKSNAIVIAKDFKAMGICAGQTSRVDAVEIAVTRACDATKDAVLASDGFFPATDNIDVAAQARIAGIIQPGGSIKDNDVIAACDKYNIAMVTTGIRHFKH